MAISTTAASQSRVHREFPYFVNVTVKAVKKQEETNVVSGTATAKAKKVVSWAELLVLMSKMKFEVSLAL